MEELQELDISKLREVIVDGETLLNDWLSLEKETDTLYFVSLSNFIYTRTLLGQTVEILENRYTKLQMEEYLQDFITIIKFLQDEDINKDLNQFAKDHDENYSNIFALKDKQGLYICIYKGFCLDHDINDLAPVIEETIAYAHFRKSQNNEIPIWSIMEELISFIKELKLDIKIKDIRK